MVIKAWHLHVPSCILASGCRSNIFVVIARRREMCDIWGVRAWWKLGNQFQFPIENRDVRYLLSHRACAELSTAVISQLSAHTTLRLMINRISSSVIKVITRATLWKATESAAIECTVSLRYIPAYFVANGIKHRTFNTCSQLELYGLHLTKGELSDFPWFHCRLTLRLWLQFIAIQCFVSGGTWSPPGLWGGRAGTFL